MCFHRLQSASLKIHTCKENEGGFQRGLHYHSSKELEGSFRFMVQIEQAHHFADAYRERFDIPSGHLFLMLNYKANITNGADEDWYEFVQRTRIPFIRSNKCPLSENLTTLNQGA